MGHVNRRAALARYLRLLQRRRSRVWPTLGRPIDGARREKRRQIATNAAYCGKWPEFEGATAPVDLPPIGPYFARLTLNGRML